MGGDGLTMNLTKRVHGVGRFNEAMFSNERGAERAGGGRGCDRAVYVAGYCRPCTADSGPWRGLGRCRRSSTKAAAAP